MGERQAGAVLDDVEMVGVGGQNGWNTVCHGMSRYHVGPALAVIGKQRQIGLRTKMESARFFTVSCIFASSSAHLAGLISPTHLIWVSPT